MIRSVFAPTPVYEERFARQTHCELTSRYPEGNFGGNQLLNDSISPSPLYPYMKNDLNDLHVSVIASLPPGILWETSEGTSYYMIRLVFRPYTRI